MHASVVTSFHVYLELFAFLAAFMLIRLAIVFAGFSGCFSVMVSAAPGSRISGMWVIVRVFRSKVTVRSVGDRELKVQLCSYDSI